MLAGETKELADAVAVARTQRAPRAPCRVQTTKRKVRVLRAGAEPGPSGWRNSHISLMARRPDGPECLTEWIRMWAQSTVPVDCAAQLTQAVNMPLNKDSTWEGVRPIALGEALLKLAEAVAVDESAVQLHAYLAPAPVVVRTPGGSRTCSPHDPHMDRGGAATRPGAD